MPPATSSKRDPRVDVLRGFALLMIFVDHIPNNLLSLATMHNFGFSDAAEVFVLLAGFSSMMAYGKVFERDGTRSGLRKIFMRLARIYLYQVALLLATLGVVFVWTRSYGLQPTIVAPILNHPVKGLAHALTLHAVPSYLDILPLYVVLFAAFPLIYFGLHRSVWLTLTFSALIWLAANLYPDFNLPNWIDGETWFFDPFAWQFLFTVGAALAMYSAGHGGALPRIPWLVWLCVIYLIFAFFEAAPWSAWHLPNLQIFGVPPPDKTHLDILRLLDMLALTYLLLSSQKALTIASMRSLRVIEACGRHSLEIFAAGCILALFGRLLFRTYGAGAAMQITVNVLGLVVMCLLGLYLERRRNAPAKASLQRSENKTQQFLA